MSEPQPSKDCVCICNRYLDHHFMPYLRKDLRREDNYQSDGALNYQITQVCRRYLSENGERYDIYEDIIGALECAKLEFYRRKVAKYENRAIVKNGDIFD